MKIFLIGLPKSGRTSIAKALVEAHGYHYIDAMSWVRSTFRQVKLNERPQQYEEEYQQYLTIRSTVNPQFIIDHVQEMMKINGTSQEIPSDVFIIDGLSSPRDFISMFDFKEDVVIFLNRSDNESDYRDHENIGISVMRDYCFWMSSAGLINKQRWLEYNFKIPGEDSDFVKTMGAQNTVFIVRSYQKMISHVTGKIKEIVESWLYS